MNLLAQKIKEVRIQKGMTQEELAAKSNINLRTIQRIEQSENYPRTSTLRLLSEALELELQELVELHSRRSRAAWISILMDAVFLISLNILFMALVSYLMFDSRANLNSRFGGVLMCFFLPFFIVVFTGRMSGLERLLKFGSGYVIYFILVMILHGIPTGIITGVFPALFIAMATLYYGSSILRIRES